MPDTHTSRSIPLAVGDKVKLADTRQRWTVRAVTDRGRFAILTKPFNIEHTVLYTVVDFDRGVRGKDNYYGLGYETDEQVAKALHSFQHTEDHDAAYEEPWRHLPTRCDDDEVIGFFCRGGAEVSHRTANHVRLDIVSVNGEPVGGDA